MNTAQVGALNGGDLGALTVTQVKALTIAQIDALAANEIGMLTTTQIGALTTTATDSLSASQLAAMVCDFRTRAPGGSNGGVRAGSARRGEASKSHFERVEDWVADPALARAAGQDWASF